MIAPTLSIDEATRRRWDVVVVGAGPSGALVAGLLAEQRLQVLLVEAKPFPRSKVCGGCLNAHGQACLQRAGWSHVWSELESVEITTLRWACGGQSFAWPLLPTMQAVERSAFDAALVRAAIARGASFLPQTMAYVGPLSTDRATRRVTLRASDHRAQSVAAHIAISADGLQATSVARESPAPHRIARHSRLGLQALLPCRDPNYPLGRLTMAASASGYVGVTAVSSDQLNLAAAIHPQALRAAHSPAEVIGQILRECQLAIPVPWSEATWIGTPPLTRAATCVASERHFLVGDATGYVEPFTGEGMAAALDAALALAPLVTRNCQHFDTAATTLWQQYVIGRARRRQWLCRGLSTIVRQPIWARWAARFFHQCPSVRQLAMRIASGERTSAWQGTSP